MTHLELPASVPLPDDVRHRALDTVLAGIDAPAPPRRAWFPALVAAAAVVALVVSVSVAVSQRPAPPLTPAAPPAAPLDVTPSDATPPTGTPPASTTPGTTPDPPPSSSSGLPGTDDLTRCADAVVTAGATGEYPPVEQWRLTENPDAFPGPDRIIFVNDQFACLLTPVSVAVTPLWGTPMGVDASLAQLSPGVLVILNPDRLMVRMSEAEQTGPTDPLIQLLVDPDENPDVLSPLIIEDSSSGPLPDPALPLEVEDRPFPGLADFPPDAVNDLNDCVSTLPIWGNSRPDVWQPAGQHDGGPSAPSVLMARIEGWYAGFCILADDGPRFSTAPPAGPDPQVIFTEPADPAYNDGVTSVLAAIPTPPNDGSGSGLLSAEIYGPDGSAGTCTTAFDLAFCAIEAEPGQLAIWLYDQDGLVAQLAV